MRTCRLTLAGREVPVCSVEDLRDHLIPVREGRPAEVWLEHPTHGSLCLLSNGREAFLMHLPDTEGEHPGWTTRAAGPVEERPVAFRLSNGQVDESPSAWVLPLEDGVEALVHFSTHGTRAPWLTWHDDSA